MNNKQKQHFFHPLVITINLLILLFLGNAIGFNSWTVAQDAPSGGKEKIVIPTGSKVEVDPIVAASCETELATFADSEFSQYALFMENNFRNKSSTSSLMGLAIARYEQFRGNIFAKYSQLIGSQLALAAAAASSNTLQGTGLEKCQALADRYIDDAAKLLSMRAISTSNIKKSSVFIEKYRQINDKLGVLNEDIMRMVVNISSFEQKLPCYLRTCV